MRPESIGMTTYLAEYHPRHAAHGSQDDIAFLNLLSLLLSRHLSLGLTVIQCHRS